MEDIIDMDIFIDMEDIMDMDVFIVLIEDMDVFFVPILLFVGFKVASVKRRT